MRAYRPYLAPILSGWAILVVAIVPWMWVSKLNATIRPDLPWAAAASLAWAALIVAWLAGFGPPAASAAWRRDSIRLRSTVPDDPGAVPAVAIAAMLVVMYAAWTAISRLSPVPDVSAYPTTSYRWSMFIMGGVMSGVIEEVAFRGYMQRGIERFDRGNAIWITSLMFVAAHITQGIGAVLTLGLGMFISSTLYGLLAQRTGSILPGMLIHVLGDLARVYFGSLRGDWSLLFAG